MMSGCVRLDSCQAEHSGGARRFQSSSRCSRRPGSLPASTARRELFAMRASSLAAVRQARLSERASLTARLVCSSSPSTLLASALSASSAIETSESKVEINAKTLFLFSCSIYLPCAPALQWNLLLVSIAALHDARMWKRNTVLHNNAMSAHCTSSSSKSHHACCTSIHDQLRATKNCRSLGFANLMRALSENSNNDIVASLLHVVQSQRVP